MIVERNWCQYSGEKVGAIIGKGGEMINKITSETGAEIDVDGDTGLVTVSGSDTAIRFMDSLDMINIVTHVADTRTCVLHPASHTHRQLSDEQLREAGVAPDLIRLSVGIEDVEDILDDIRQALEVCP